MMQYYSEQEYEPSIYFIIKDNVVYIDSSNKMAVIDWGNQLTVEGDFSNKLRDYSESLFSENYKIHFLNFNCSEIKQYSEKSYVKTELLFIEDLIHSFFNRGGYLDFKLLSDTKRTAPRKVMKEEDSRKLAEKIYNQFKEKFKMIIKTPV